MRIKQSAVFLNDVVRELREGRVAPADFQRPFVWTEDDVLKLIKSILVGYPIGSLVVWTPHGKADLTKVGRSRLGPIAMRGAGQYASLVLDGQHRLATLAWMAHDPRNLPEDLTAHETDVWGRRQLVCDLDAGVIRLSETDRGDGVFRLPVRVLFDKALLNRLLVERFDGEWRHLSVERKEGGLRLLDAWENAFREARVIVVDVENATAAEALDAFLHICKVGVPMSEKDFSRALAWAM